MPTIDYHKKYLECKSKYYHSNPSNVIIPKEFKNQMILPNWFNEYINAKQIPLYKKKQLVTFYKNNLSDHVMIFN